MKSVGICSGLIGLTPLLFNSEKDAEQYFKQLSVEIIDHFKITPKGDLVSKATERELEFTEFCFGQRWRLDHRKFTYIFDGILCIFESFGEKPSRVHCQVLNTPFGRKTLEISDEQVIDLVCEIATDGFAYPYDGDDT
jgi:hypothetical protein